MIANWKIVQLSIEDYTIIVHSKRKHKENPTVTIWEFTIGRNHFRGQKLKTSSF